MHEPKNTRHPETVPHEQRNQLTGASLQLEAFAQMLADDPELLADELRAIREHIAARHVHQAEISPPSCFRCTPQQRHRYTAE